MTSPAASRWPHIKALFEEVVDLPAAQREAPMAAAGLDATDINELRSLLAHHDEATGAQAFMRESAASQMAEAHSAGAARTGQRLGAWEIVRPVGTGGMGEVFEARRADGSYEGRAAVKLLKRGLEADLAGEALSAIMLSQSLLLALVRDDPKVPRWNSTRRLFAMHHGRARSRPVEQLRRWPQCASRLKRCLPRRRRAARYVVAAGPA